MKDLTRVFCAVVVTTLLLSTAEAGLVTGNCLHDEATNGDFSTDHMAPTDLMAMVAGSNSVAGLIDDAMAAGNVDVFSFEVPTGFVLDGVFVRNYQYTNPPPANEENAFLAINDDTFFPYDTFGLDINNNPFFDENLFLGGSVFGLSDLATAPLNAGVAPNILGRIGNITGRGFTGPLDAGTYTIYIQQTGPENSYTLDFNVTAITAVPEPAHLSLFAFAAFVAARRRRRRKGSSQTLPASA